MIDGEIEPNEPAIDIENILSGLPRAFEYTKVSCSLRNGTYNKLNTLAELFNISRSALIDLAVSKPENYKILLDAAIKAYKEIPELKQ